jgi:hypothetical protein
MAARFDIKIKNADLLRKQFNQAPFIMAKHVAEGLNKSVFAIEAKAIDITPVKTGFLVGSYARGRLLARPVGASQGVKLGARVKPTAKYASFVHDIYNTSRKYKNPTKNSKARAQFLKKGLADAQPDIDNFMNDAADKITKEIARTKVI